MRRLGLSAVVLLTLPLLAADPTPAALLDEADAAFAGGDYALAEQLYALAEPRAADPGRVTLGLAAAKYRRALAQPTRSGVLLSEAEDLYRCCLDAADPRRVTALVGLGNCLVREAGSRNARAAQAAADQYREVAPRAGDTPLAEAARYNLQRARLLARQIATVPPDKDDKPPSDDPQRDRKLPEGSAPPRDGAEGGDGKKAGSRQATADAGQQATESDDARAPGAGELPPVPDRDGLPPLTPAEARQHLTDASRRIMEEGRRYRRGSARPASPGVPDW